MTITPSHLLEYLFCPRYTYFEYVLRIPQHETKYYKVLKGREIHAQKARQHTEYLRKRLGVISKKSNVYLSGGGLRGEVDEVLFFKDKAAAPLDYKFARYDERVYETYQIQLVCYALLIEANFDVTVNKGFLIYTRSKHKLVEIEVSKALRRRTQDHIKAVFQIIQQNHFPKATKFKKRCVKLHISEHLHSIMAFPVANL